MIYKNYIIERDITGYAPKNCEYAVFNSDGNFVFSCASIEECKNQIDEIQI